MDLKRYLAPECVVLLAEEAKDPALRTLCDVLAAHEAELKAPVLFEAVCSRERLMSTGIGNGLAIPHVRLKGLSGACMAIGISREGLKDYQSLDAQPIRLVVLIAAPQGEHETYIRLLARVTDVLRVASLREAILEAPDAAAAYRILTGSQS